MTFFWILLIVSGIVLLWAFLRGSSKASSAIRPEVMLKGTGDYDLEVVGESNYQPALRAVCGPGEVRHKCQATLVLEDENAYDKKAVRVDIGGNTVGYLSREAARAYRKGLKKAGHPTLVAACEAIIIGGGKGRESLGVWLDIPVDE